MDLRGEVARLRRESDAFASSGNWGPEAEAVNRRLIELVPGYVIAYTRAARCVVERGDAQGAQALYLAVLKIDPQNVIARNHIRQTASRPAQLGVSGSNAGSNPLLLKHSAGGTNSAPSPELRSLHQRLESHFLALRQHRDALAPGTPLFALEHGLSATEVDYVFDAVRNSVTRGVLPYDAWLPFAIYATELGYDYSGDEYWLTFEDRTPGWVQRGDRDYIRDVFSLFQKEFGGAVPRGAWARQFSIICWPITHAILPTDLQRQLARLLFEYRRVYTSQLLADPAEFGRRLSARAWQTSPRFRIFAQNSELLGHVGAALLLSFDGDCPYLLKATLQRILHDLESEREAKTWLQHARHRAGEVRAKGLHPVVRREAGIVIRDGQRLPVSTDPVISVRESGGTWSAYLEIPDLSVLSDRLPSLVRELSDSRAIVAGVAGAPLARKQLLFPGKEVKLSSWPSAEAPLIQLEKGSAAANSLLRDQCVMSPGPIWVFLIGEGRMGGEVRGKFVRPSRQYLILTRDQMDQTPQDVRQVACATAGIYAYHLSLPQALDTETIASLKQIHLTTVTDVTVRPAGLVPAMWDGEGVAEWLVGDQPLIAVGSSREVGRGIFTLDGEPFTIEWPSQESEVFLQLDGLDVGSHDLRCSLFPADLSQPIADGILDIIIRVPVMRTATGSYREGLMIAANPVSPTLEEMWAGHATVEVIGPTDVEVAIDVTIMDRGRRSLGGHRTVITLPVTADEWLDIVMTHTRSAHSIERKYVSAEVALIRVSHPLLGAAELECERAFSPLRWASGSDRDGPFARLVNNTASDQVRVFFYSFENPDVAAVVEGDELSRFREARGGLLHAIAGEAESSVVLAPHVRELTDLKGLAVRATFAERARTADGLLGFLICARLWADASLPANPVAGWQRVLTLRAFRDELETFVSAPSAESGRGADIRLERSQLYSDIKDHIDTLARADTQTRVNFFAGALAIARFRIGGYTMPFGPRDNATPETRLAEFLLRIASVPYSVLEWPSEELERGLDLVIRYPVLLRAARFLVDKTAARRKGADEALSEGWTWQ